MIDIKALVAHFPALDVTLVEDWVARGWVRAEPDSPAGWVFTDTDVSRLLLLRELQVDLALDEEALPVVLSLLDQVYGLRRTLDAVLAALGDAPDEVRQRVFAALSPDNVLG